MKSEASPLHDSILNAWSTNDRVTTFLVEQLPDSLWEAAVPGSPRRTIRVIASHMHNARLYVDQDARKTAWHRGASSGGSAPGHPFSARPRFEAQWTGDRQPTGAGARAGRADSANTGVCMAQIYHSM